MLFHDGDHGEPLIHALARFGEGLPANVLPVRVNEVTQIGPEALAALFAYGAVGVQLLARPGRSTISRPAPDGGARGNNRCRRSATARRAGAVSI